MIRRVVLVVSLSSVSLVSSTPTQAIPAWQVFGGDRFGFDDVGAVTLVPTIYDAVDFRGDLVVTGYFETATGLQVNGIARWDGSQWHALGNGLRNKPTTSPGAPVFGHTLVVFDDQLYVGGAFERAGDVDAGFVARWDGNEWFPVGLGFNQRVYDLTVYRGRLVAGGGLTRSGTLPAARVAEFQNDRWRPLGEGFDLPCLTLQAHGDLLYAGGAFSSTPAGRGLNRVAVWDGQVWIGVGERISVDESRYPSPTLVQDMTVHDGLLTITGTFDRAGTDPLPGVAALVGGRWRQLGPPGTSMGSIESGFSLASHRGQLYLGGRLAARSDPSMRFVARWDGEGWFSMGSGVDDFVQALVPMGDDLVVAGAFRRAGTEASQSLAIWRTGPLAVLRPAVTLTRESQGVRIVARVEGLDAPALLRVERDRGEGTSRRLVGAYELRAHGELRVVDETAPAAPLRYWLSVERGFATHREFGPYAVAAPGPIRSGLQLLAASAQAPVRVQLRVATAGAHRLEIYDLRGRHVITLLDEAVEAGTRVVEWDGRDGAGRAAARGRYLLRAVGEGWVDVIGAVLLR